MSTTHTANETLATSTTIVAGETYQAISFWRTTAAREGRVEIYRDIDGIMTFLGYADELAGAPHTAERVHSLVVAHLEICAAYWAQFLPGARNWMVAA